MDRDVAILKQVTDEQRMLRMEMALHEMQMRRDAEFTARRAKRQADSEAPQRTQSSGSPFWPLRSIAQSLLPSRLANAFFPKRG